MLRIAGRSAVSAREYFPFAFQTGSHQFPGCGKWLRERFHCFQFDLSAVVEVIIDSCDEIHRVSGEFLSAQEHWVEVAFGNADLWADVVTRGGKEFTLLACVNALPCAAKGAGSAHANLYENQRLAIAHDHVDLAKAATVVALNRSQALAPQVIESQFFGLEPTPGH